MRPEIQPSFQDLLQDPDGALRKLERKEGHWLMQMIPGTRINWVMESITGWCDERDALPMRLEEVNESIWGLGRNGREKGMQRLLGRIRDTRTPGLILGEFSAREVAEIREVSPAKLITFLRHPADRLVTSYQHQISKRYRSSRSFQKRYPTVVDYVSDPAHQNEMLGALCDEKGLSWRRAERYLRENYLLVGIEERMEFSLGWLARVMGKERTGVDFGKPEHGAGEVLEENHELLELIRQKNRADFALYQAMREASLALPDPPRGDALIEVPAEAVELPQ